LHSISLKAEEDVAMFVLDITLVVSLESPLLHRSLVLGHIYVITRDWDGLQLTLAELPLKAKGMSARFVASGSKRREPVFSMTESLEFIYHESLLVLIDVGQ